MTAVFGLYTNEDIERLGLVRHMKPELIIVVEGLAQTLRTMRLEKTP